MATTCPMTCPSDLRTSQHMRVSHSTQFWAILVRESREGKWIKLIASWESWSWPKGFHFWTTLLNDFQGSFLRVFDVFPYFHVWENWKCQETILFHKGRLSFWGFKNSVHLRLKEQIFTRNCLSDFGGCRFPNQALFSFLESPRSLVYFPKISAHNSLWFRNYRSWSARCSQEI